MKSLVGCWLFVVGWLVVFKFVATLSYSLVCTIFSYKAWLLLFNNLINLIRDWFRGYMAIALISVWLYPLLTSHPVFLAADS
jgi:hypothetical protein